MCAREHGNARVGTSRRCDFGGMLRHAACRIPAWNREFSTHPARDRVVCVLPRILHFKALSLRNGVFAYVKGCWGTHCVEPGTSLCTVGPIPWTLIQARRPARPGCAPARFLARRPGADPGPARLRRWSCCGQRTSGRPRWREVVQAPRPCGCEPFRPYVVRTQTLQNRRFHCQRRNVGARLDGADELGYHRPACDKVSLRVSPAAHGCRRSRAPALVTKPRAAPAVSIRHKPRQAARTNAGRPHSWCEPECILSWSSPRAPGTTWPR